MDFFTNLTLAINRNCENEKERLKAMQIGFSKREKDLSKAVEKRKQMPVELDKFYDRELAEIRDQQVATNHNKLLYTSALCRRNAINSSWKSTWKC